jgi:parvulin-like peptidyl-prolyl isomerase
MMAKVTKQQKELTKKQIARSRRDKQQQKRILFGIGVVAVLILGIALAGLSDQLIIQPARPVAVVNGVRIRTDEYQTRVLYDRFVLDQFLQNLQAQFALLDPNDPTSQFLAQYYQQIGNQAQQQRLTVDRQAVDELVEEELVRQKAAELGLTVGEDELNETIRARIAGMAGSITESQATAAASTAAAATATAETFTPTPEPTSTPTLTATQVTTGTPTVTPEIPTPAPTPTRHIITDDEFKQDYANYLSLLKEQTGVTEAKYRRIVQAGLLVNKVSQYFADQVPTEAEQVNVSHIQSDTEEKAQAAENRLDAGEDFAVVASEVSSDTLTAANGGELGWFPEGDLAAQFGPATEDSAFSLSPGEYSQPITSTLGWQIVKVNERGVRPLSQYDLQTRQQQAYSDWLQEAKSAPGVEILWKPEMAPPDPLLEQSTNLPAGGAPSGGSSQP